MSVKNDLYYYNIFKHNVKAFQFFVFTNKQFSRKSKRRDLSIYNKKNKILNFESETFSIAHLRK